MTELLLHIAQPQQAQLQKIAPSIYYSSQNNAFYRLSFLPHTVVFQNEQISQPHLATLTPFDPYFFLINLLVKRSVSQSQIPSKFKQLDMSKVADIKTEGQRCYILNKEKVYNYLQGKVEAVQKCLSQKLGEKTLEVDKEMKCEKQIREETVVILKSEIEDKSFVDTFARERYNYQNIRKLVPYMEQPQELETRRKNVVKKEPKKQQKKLQQGQKTLMGFFKGKK